jgi:hypothetical protein
MTILRKYVLSFIMLAVLGMVGLLLLEVTMRILHPEATRAKIMSRLKKEMAPWSRPDAEFHHVGGGILHLQFPDPLEAFPARIMIVGDSFVAGHGVGEEKRFGTLLQQQLGKKIKVDVLATSSYSPVIYRSVVRKALSLSPYRAVIVFVDQTDPADDLLYQEDVIEDSSSQKFNLTRMTERTRIIYETYSSLFMQLSGWANLRRLAIVNLLKPLSLVGAFKPGDKYYRYVSLSPRSGLIKEFNIEPDSKESQEMLSLLLNHLDQIVTLCREQQVPLFLAANPWEFQSARKPKVTIPAVQVPGPYPKDNRLETLLTMRYGNLAGVYVIPLTQSFRAHEDPANLFLDNPENEIHWNAKGHILVESVLRKFLLAKLPELGRAGGQKQ